MNEHIFLSYIFLFDCYQIGLPDWVDYRASGHAGAGCILRHNKIAVNPPSQEIPIPFQSGSVPAMRN
jgi:hypothetical protein